MYVPAVSGAVDIHPQGSRRCIGFDAAYTFGSLHWRTLLFVVTATKFAACCHGWFFRGRSAPKRIEVHWSTEEIDDGDINIYNHVSASSLFHIVLLSLKWRFNHIRFWILCDAIVRSAQIFKMTAAISADSVPCSSYRIRATKMFRVFFFYNILQFFSAQHTIQKYTYSLNHIYCKR